MSTARHLANSFDDYLRIEETSEVRHEFIGGEIYAMPGGTPEHGALMARASSLLQGLWRNCTPFSSDVRVHIEKESMMTYPDAFFVCGPTTRSTIDTDAITNPTVIVEVTSKTTESYDRTEKLAAYQTIDSLRAVVFVSHREHRVTIVERAETSWLSTEFRGGERAVISSPPAEFAVDELYQVLERL